MKKLSALLLALALLMSAVPTAFAANTTPNTTTLTTTVPSATYVLNIPADQEISFGQTRTDIGNVTITDSKNFAEGKNVDVTVEYVPFAAETEGISTTIPYVLYPSLAAGGKYSVSNIESGSKLTFKGKVDGTVSELTVFRLGSSQGFSEMKSLIVSTKSTDWGKALAGDYKSTITFTSEVVAE